MKIFHFARNEVSCKHPLNLVFSPDAHPLVRRSCCLQKFFKKDEMSRILRNVTIFTGKHLCWGLFLIELQALSKRYSNKGVFLWILRNFKKRFFIERLRWLLLVFHASVEWFLHTLTKLVDVKTLSYRSCFWATLYDFVRD